MSQTFNSYHQLNRQEQVIIFRLRTGHNRLNHHMNQCASILRLLPAAPV